MKRRGAEDPAQRVAIWLWTVAWAIVALLMVTGVIPREYATGVYRFAVIVGLFTGVVSIVFRLNQGGRWN